MLLKIARTHKHAKLPARANPSDAGSDVFFCPKQTHDAFDFIRLDPGESVVLPTGIKVEVPHGYMLEVKNKSGVASKKSLVVGACVIDSGYSGEVFVNLHNIGNLPQSIAPGQKIAQLVLIPVVQWRSFLVDENKLYVDELTISNRGTGTLGSTGDT